MAVYNRRKHRFRSSGVSLRRLITSSVIRPGFTDKPYARKRRFVHSVCFSCKMRGLYRDVVFTRNADRMIRALS